MPFICQGWIFHKVRFQRMQNITMDKRQENPPLNLIKLYSRCHSTKKNNLWLSKTHLSSWPIWSLMMTHTTAHPIHWKMVKMSWWLWTRPVFISMKLNKKKHNIWEKRLLEAIATEGCPSCSRLIDKGLILLSSLKVTRKIKMPQIQSHRNNQSKITRLPLFRLTSC